MSITAATRHTEVQQGLKNETNATFDLQRHSNPSQEIVQDFCTEKGIVHHVGGVLTEADLGAAGVYTLTIPIPAESWLVDLQITNQALWTADTSATLKAGDTADDDGFFVGVSTKGTDMVVGEVLSINGGNNWGAKQGAYLTTAGRKGAVATNFATYYAAGSNLIVTITTVGTVGTAGITHVLASFVKPKTIESVGVLS
jgi:hypothetical protein